MPKVSGLWEEKGETEESTVCEVEIRQAWIYNYCIGVIILLVNPCKRIKTILPQAGISVRIKGGDFHCPEGGLLILTHAQ